jgi:cytochrome c553
MAEPQGLQALRAATGAEPPAGLVQQLSDADLAQLAALVDEARRAQATALARAGEDALRHVPRLLRVAIERALR